MSKEPAPKMADRVVLVVPQQMATAIDDYWHSHRLRSRGEAVRQLLAYALERLPEPRLDKVARK